MVRQRIEWGQNLKSLLEERGWSRKRFLLLMHEQYGIDASESSLAQWIKGEVAPRPDVQAAAAAVGGIPHHLLFPPVKLQRRVAA